MVRDSVVSTVDDSKHAHQAGRLEADAAHLFRAERFQIADAAQTKDNSSNRPSAVPSKEFPSSYVMAAAFDALKN